MPASIFPGYFLNGLLLLAPILLWNWVFSAKLPKAFLPENFNQGIPVFISGAENILRLVVFSLPFFMPLNLATPTQRLGFWLYSLGTGLYFLSWLALMLFPKSSWSTSACGFLAPAYTPLIWLVGIGLVGSSLYIPVPYWPGIYLVCAVLFIAAHVSHASIVYLKSI